MTASSPPPSFGQRFVLAFACFFRVLFDPRFAKRALGLDAAPALEAAAPTRVLDVAKPEATSAPEPAPREPVAPTGAPSAASKPATPPEASALTLLSLLQREGRLVDFLQQDLSGFDDTDVGVAARVVHEGCRKALRDHATLEPVRHEEEGSPLTLEAGYDAHAVKLTGDVRGSAPFRGVLRHRGWRAAKLSLPETLDAQDLSILAPAEVEL